MTGAVVLIYSLLSIFIFIACDLYTFPPVI